MHYLIVIPLTLAVLSIACRRYQFVAKSSIPLVWCHLLLTFLFVAPVLRGRPLNLPDGFLVDRLAACFLLLTAFVFACSLTHARRFFDKEIERSPQILDKHIRLFYCFSFLFLLSMQTVFVCGNLGWLWISIEATTLISAGLVFFGRDKHAIEATWKYLIICSVGIAFALLGTVCIYVSSLYSPHLPHGSLDVTQLTSFAPELENTFRRLAFVFCLVGYGTKAGVFPLHSWLPDAHSEAPAPASAILSGSLLNCSLFAIFRLSQIAQSSNQSAVTTDLVIWAGSLSVLAASLFLVRQWGLKRLWAYSSIENVGLMLLAIGLGSGSLFFLQALNHSIAKVALFLISGNVIQITGTKALSEIRGLFSTSPSNSALLLVAAVAATGLPPFGAFIPEWSLLVDSAGRGLWIQFSLVLLGLSLSFIAISYHVGRILVGKPRVNRGVGESPASIESLSIPTLLVLASLALGITVDTTRLCGNSDHPLQSSMGSYH